MSPLTLRRDLHREASLSGKCSIVESTYGSAQESTRGRSGRGWSDIREASMISGLRGFGLSRGGDAGRGRRTGMFIGEAFIGSKPLR